MVNRKSERVVTSDEIFPASYSQLRYWLLEQMYPGTAAYNIAIAFDLSGSLDNRALRDSVAEVARRHDILRTTFAETGGELKQRVSSDSLVTVTLMDRTHTPDDQRDAEIARLVTEEGQKPFDLTSGALLRLNVVCFERERHLMLLTTHHIVSDAWSMGIFLREVSTLYASLLHGAGRTLEPLSIQYGDYALWQREWIESETAREQLRYWKHHLQGHLTDRQIPTDFRRPTKPSFDGRTEPCQIDAQLTGKLKAMSRREKCSLFMTLSAALQTMICLRSGQDDALFGSPIANRNHAETQNLIGPFANTVVLCCNLSGNPTFQDVLRRLRETTLSAYTNQDLPFDRVVTELRVGREPGRNPIFDFMFALQNVPETRLELEGITAQVLSMTKVSSPLDLGLQLTEEGNRMRGIMAYRPSLFRSSTILGLLRDFDVLLRTVVEKPSIRIRELPLSTSGQQPAIAIQSALDQTLPSRRSVEEIEAALLEHPSVRDCFVLMREVENQPAHLVAYVVPRLPIPLKDLQLKLRDILASYSRPLSIVRVSSLPFDEDGNLDQSALMALPVIDLDLMHRCESRLPSAFSADRIAVLPMEIESRPGVLHISDLSNSAKISLEKRDAHEPSRGSATESPLAIASWAPIGQHDYPSTLQDALKRVAQTTNHGITCWKGDKGEVFQSYKELSDEAARILNGLRNMGLRPNDRVILQIQENEEFLPAFWACILGGFVPVPIPVAHSYDTFNRIIENVRGTWQLLAHPLVLADGRTESTIRRSTELAQLDGFRVECLETAKKWGPDYNWHESSPDSNALFLLTSGSTSVPKLVCLSHRNLLSRSAATAIQNGFSDRDVSINWMPLDHVGGLIMFHLMDLFLGAQQIHVPTHVMLQNPLWWLDCIQRYRATITWAPNFAYRLITDRAREISAGRWDLSTMRFILNGGEAINPQTAASFLRLLAQHGLPTTAMHPAWGMSETCSGVTFFHGFRAELVTEDTRFVPVGSPIPGCSVRIVDDGEQVVQEHVVGHLQVKGPMVTSGYYCNEQLNREVFTDDGWFRTGDLGFLETGQLTITGRQKDTLIINGVKFYSHEIEARVEQIAGVETSYTAACAVRKARSDTDQLVVFVSTLIPHAEVPHLLERVRSHLVDVLGINPDYILPLNKTDIPKTSAGKIQRSLMTRQFEQGTYDSLIRRIDLDTRNRNTVPDLFHRIEWSPRVASAFNKDWAGSRFLIFNDSVGFGQVVCAQLGQLGCQLIIVHAGKEFAQIDLSHFEINPDNTDDYHKLFASIAERGFWVSGILHMWLFRKRNGPVTMDEFGQTQTIGLYSILSIANAIASLRTRPQTTNVYVVTNDAQSVLAHESAHYDKKTISGLLKTIPLEIDWMQCVHVDFSGCDELEAKCRQLLLEVGTKRTEPEVAYRKSQRFVPRLARVNFAESSLSKAVIAARGHYLVTGGLGGIGTALAKFLVRRYNAKVLLVGRTVLPDRESWERHVTLKTPIGRKVRNYLSLRGLDCVYEAADICDLKRMNEVVANAEKSWQAPLNAVFHLAGEGHLQTHWPVADKHRIERETREAFEWMFKPKVLGTHFLYELFKERPELPIVSFSSVNSIFGGASFAAYSSANSFLDAYVHWRRNNTHPESYVYNWTMWNDIGMSEDNPDFARGAAEAMGFSILNSEPTFLSLVAMLNHGIDNVIVGVQEQSPHIRSRVNTPCKGLDQLVAYVSADKQTLSSLPTIDVEDRFGVRVGCEIRALEPALKTNTGQVDWNASQGTENPRRRKVESASPSRTPLERQIAELWERLLGVSDLGFNENFFELGGHSLLATQLVSRINELFHIELPLRTVFENPTLTRLCNNISKALSASENVGRPLIRRAERPAHIPLSYAQERLWFLTQLAPDSAFYNVPCAWRLKGHLDVSALSRAFKETIRRHEVLRTTIQFNSGHPAQKVFDGDNCEGILNIEMSSLDGNLDHSELERLARTESETPFDLEHEFPIRARLVRVGDNDHVLFLTVHHIAFDGWSVGVLHRELGALYDAYRSGKQSPLPNVSIQYADYALWQRGYLNGPALEKHLEYWKKQLLGAPMLDLPSDRPRHARQTFKGAHIIRSLDRTLSHNIKELGHKHETTLFMTLLAGLLVVFERYSGQTDLVVGAPIANRNRSEIEYLIGFFVNMLPIRVDLSADPHISELLAQVRGVALQAYEHQDLPFEILVEELRPDRDLSRHPLFQVTLAIQNSPVSELSLPGLRLSTIEQDTRATRFDLEGHVWDGPDGLTVIFDYSKDLFDRARIDRMVNHWENILREMVGGADRRISELDMLGGSEQSQMFGWSRAERA